MRWLRKVLRQVWRDQRGLEIVQVAVLAGLGVVLALAAYKIWGSGVMNSAQDVKTQIEGAPSQNPSSW